MKHFSTFLLVFSLSFIFGCQSSKKINCSRVNWRLEGQKAATLGMKQTESLGKIVEQCKNKDRLVDESAFNAGYADGLRLFCKTETGLSMGTSGQIYSNTCPENSENAFLKGYINGRIIYLQNKLNTNSIEYANAKDRFWRKEQEYLLLKNEDPEQAKMQKDFLEAYQEESVLLEQDLNTLKKELAYLKMKKEEMKFN